MSSVMIINRNITIEPKEDKFLVKVYIEDELIAEEVVKRLEEINKVLEQVNKDIESIPATVAAREAQLKEQLKFATEEADIFKSVNDKARLQVVINSKVEERSPEPKTE